MLSALPRAGAAMKAARHWPKALETGSGNGGRLAWGVASMQGWRDNQEDAHLALPDFDPKRRTALFGVFDGHGGATVAKIVAERLPDVLKGQAAYQAGRYDEALTHSFQQLDDFLTSRPGRREVGRHGPGENPDFQGCTAVVALIRGGVKPEIIVANAGDSRCVLVSASKAVDLSRDHAPTLPDELARVKKAGGYVTREGRINDNLNLSRALGDLFYKTNKRLKPCEQLISGVPEITRHTLTEADSHLTIGCDGIWDQSSSQQVVNFQLRQLASNPGLSEACAAFEDKNVSVHPVKTDGLGCDNMTLMMIDLLSGEKQVGGSDDLDKSTPVSVPDMATETVAKATASSAPKRRLSSVRFSRSQRRRTLLACRSYAE